MPALVPHIVFIETLVVAKNDCEQWGNIIPERTLIQVLLKGLIKRHEYRHLADIINSWQVNLLTPVSLVRIQEYLRSYSSQNAYVHSHTPSLQRHHQNRYYLGSANAQSPHNTSYQQRGSTRSNEINRNASEVRQNRNQRLPERSRPVFNNNRVAGNASTTCTHCLLPGHTIANCYKKTKGKPQL